MFEICNWVDIDALLSVHSALRFSECNGLRTLGVTSTLCSLNMLSTLRRLLLPFALLSLAVQSGAGGDAGGCDVVYKMTSPSCNRLKANKVIIHGAPCQSGAEATLQILGYNEFPANETLTTGDYQCVTSSF